MEELREQLEELKRPPKLSEREMQRMLSSKVDDGSLTEGVPVGLERVRVKSAENTRFETLEE